SGREDRWREFGFDGYSRERFRREIVIERCPLERGSYRDRRGRKGGHRETADMIDTVRHMAGARRLRPVAPACHVGANAHLPNRHARRQRLNRCADEERQRQANRQETFRDRRHAAKTWPADDRVSAQADLTLASSPFLNLAMTRDFLDSLSEKLQAPSLS